MDLYAENILDHYHHPRGKAPLPSADIEHEEVNHSCGDTLNVQLTIANEKITGIGWEGTGCAISQAGMSILSEDLVGKTMKEIEGMGEKEMKEMLGVPVGTRRIKCALLALHTLKNALRAWQKLPPQDWSETMKG